MVLGAGLILVLAAGSASAQTCDTYEIIQTNGNPVAGTNDIGSNCDDCTVAVPLPFPVQFYNGIYNSANVASNGYLQFVSNNATFTNICLPDGSQDTAIFAHWDDLMTNISGTDGIFTATTGVAPNRSFIIEWRTPYFPGVGNANFSVILHEDTPNFEVIYGTIDQGGSSATIGVQDGTGSSFTEYACDTPGSAITGRQLNFVCGGTESVLEVPALSATGLSVLIAALAAIGIVAMRRRRSA
jgi:hypothetical protein